MIYVKDKTCPRPRTVIHVKDKNCPRPRTVIYVKDKMCPRSRTVMCEHEEEIAPLNQSQWCQQIYKHPDQTSNNEHAGSLVRYQKYIHITTRVVSGWPAKQISAQTKFFTRNCSEHHVKLCHTHMYLLFVKISHAQLFRTAGVPCLLFVKIVHP